MTSQAQAVDPLPGVRGLAFLGFPLHPAGRPSQDRAKHLFDVKVPMLFLQGTRDTLAALDQLEPLCKALGRRATLKLFAEADHSFHVPARTGRKDAEVRGEVLDALAAWIDGVIASPVCRRAGLAGPCGLRPRWYCSGESLASTIILPIGHSAMPASFRCAQANGMPMMVMASRQAVMRWPSASHQPASTSHTMLPMRPKGPVPKSSVPRYSARDTALRPNGSSV